MAWKRGQIVWSLWSLSVGERAPPWTMQEISPLFTRRVTNLIDRGIGVRPARSAGQTGIDNSYEVLDALEIAIGLRLYVSSWPQEEIEDFIKQHRAEFRGELFRLSKLSDNVRA